MLFSERLFLSIILGEPGWYATHWRFCQRGRVFGNQMWCAIYVADRNMREKLEPVQGEDVAVSAFGF